MSGPVTTIDAPPDAAGASRGAPPEVEITLAREAMVGKIRVRRSLPRRERRTVGAWCFLDHMGPASVTKRASIDVGPHPHAGLHTVTWLIEDEILHRDSLGSEQVIRPGQLNLMTAGQGVAHSEEATVGYRSQLYGVQLWVAQAEATRHGPAAFEDYPELPRIELGRSEATILVGTFDGKNSLHALTHRSLAAMPCCTRDLRSGRSSHRLNTRWWSSRALSSSMPKRLKRANSRTWARGDRSSRCTRMRRPAWLLLGGEPFVEPIVMWWNFVARSRAEVDAATRAWNAQDPRFGSVASPLDRIPAPSLPEARP